MGRLRSVGYSAQRQTTATNGPPHKPANAMKWLTLAAAALATLTHHVTLVQSQCFTNNDRFNVVLQTNLSNIADFGLDLLREFSAFSPEGNVIFSPYSIWSALSLAYFGSAGKTESQLRAVLRAESKIGALRMHKALDLTYQLRNLVGVNYVFKLANKIYVDENLPFRNCTINVLPNEIEHVDFRNKQKAVDKINTFVSDKTEGRIKDLVDADALTDAQLVLVNAAYFKGSWLRPFKPSMTHSAVFTTDKSKGELKMMHLKERLKYVEDKDQGIRLLELPYDDQVVSMFLVLPSSAGDQKFEGVLSRLEGPLLQKAMAGMTTKLVNLTLPKFTYEMTLTKELTESLINLGVTDLFNRTTGNLTRFVEGTSMGVSESIHRAFIEVSEEGTEAAAATAFVVNTRMGPAQAKVDFVEFHCDRPFLYYLYDNDTSNVLFLGTFRSPKENSHRSFPEETMMWASSVVAPLALLLLLGVLSPTGAQPQPQPQPQPQSQQLKCPDTRLVTIYPDLSEVMDFQVDLFKRLTTGTWAGKNFLMSPFSVWSAFTLAYFGARGQTQEQMEKVLRVSDKSSAFHLWRDLGAMFDPDEKDPLFEFTTVNRAYFNESLQINPLAMDLLKNEMSFFNSNNPNDAIQDINSFVSDVTKGKVREIVTVDDMERAQMVLVNAAYFNGRWVHHFDANDTAPGAFFVDSKANVTVGTMRQKESFRYGSSPSLGARILDMRYKGNDISMFLVVPTEDVGPVETRLDTLLKRLNGSSLRSLMASMKVEVVDLQMPKFNFEMGMCEEMRQALVDMGMTHLFNETLADMTAFTTSAHLNVDKVIHKNHIEVNEDGTEAAAVTGIISTVLSAQIPVEPVPFHCNEPFLYLIFDKRTKNVLFVGTYRNPADF
ncbi:uncharacterized protein [Macrobrachium rosenbergii]|uniref:uncharacterized protein n=1 Tax=Macrobrachium rosenbergii TaxID=79674 RepID=UPI0034D4AB8D